MFERKYVILVGFLLVTFIGLPFFVSADEGAAKDDLLKELSALIDEKPEVISSFIYTIGDDYVMSGKVDEAIALYEKALSIIPENEDILNRLANLANQKQDYTKAAEIYNKMLELRPDNTWYYNALSEALKNAGETDKAGAVWEEQLKNSTNAELFLQAANFYSGQDNLEKAIEVSKKAAELAPDNINYLQNLESFYVKAEKFDEAEKVCDKILAKTKEPWAKNWVNSELINIYQKQGKTDELSEKFEAELEANPNDIGKYKKLADLYQRSGSQADAIEVYEDAIKTGIEDRDINFKLLELYEQNERSGKAIAQIKKIMGSSPEEKHMHERLANVLAKTGKKDEAKKAWETYISQSPKDAGIFSRYGDRLSDWGDFEGAVVQYRKALKLDPKNVWYNMRIADKLLLANKPEEAKKELNIVISSNADEWMKKEAKRKIEEADARLNIPKSMPVEEKKPEAKEVKKIKPEPKNKEKKVESKKEEPEEEKTEKKKPKKEKKKRSWFSW